MCCMFTEFCDSPQEGLSLLFLTGRRTRTDFTKGVIFAPGLENGWEFGKGWGWGGEVWPGQSRGG